MFSTIELIYYELILCEAKVCKKERKEKKKQLKIKMANEWPPEKKHDKTFPLINRPIKKRSLQLFRKKINRGHERCEKRFVLILKKYFMNLT